MKQIQIRETTHQIVKILAAEANRKIHCDLVDDLILFGVEEYQRILHQEKNFNPDVTYTRYNVSSEGK